MYFVIFFLLEGGGPRVVVRTAAFHARVRGSVPGLGGLKETKMFLSNRQGSNFESRVWRTVSSQSSHHPQEVLLTQFSLYVHKGGLKPDSFHFISFFCLRLFFFYFVFLISNFIYINKKIQWTFIYFNLFVSIYRPAKSINTFRNFHNSQFHQFY